MSNSNTSLLWEKRLQCGGKTTGRLEVLFTQPQEVKQIVREYNPNVSNPSTGAQVNQRADETYVAVICVFGSLCND